MLYHIKKYLRTHFGFSKSESRGTLVLLVAINCLVVAGTVLKFIKNNRQPTNIPLIEESIINSKLIKFDNAPNRLNKANSKTKADIAVKSPISKPNKVILLDLQQFDINSAEVEDLRKIKGIGEVLSTRIIKFRNKLGGFVSVEQYEEIYGLELEVVKRMCKQTFITKAFCPKKLNINTVTIKELVAHPYIKYECARAIVNYREKNGLYDSIDSVTKFFEENGLKYEKAMPYLTL